MTRAAAYIRTRQSPSGGFCFYRYGGIDEPNLGDTYYSVAALRLFGIEVPNARKTAEFVSQARIFGLTYLYFCSFTLDHLGLASRISEEKLAAIRNLSITVPEAGRSVDTSGWLESVRKTIRLQQRFAPTSLGSAARRDKENPGSGASDDGSESRYAQVSGFVADLMKRGGFGVRSNLWDSCVVLSVGSLLGLRPPEEMAAFIEALQQPPVGFLMTPHSAVTSLDVAYAGARCCEILALAVRHSQEVIDFTLSCQTTNGGFAHASMALPNLEFTYRGLQTLALLVPELMQRPNAESRR
ncbi:MAG: prenyltransferase/squalene oxidase repeat-containing protein [Steroidobacteraceae bacterium]